MRIESPQPEAVDDIDDLWVALARSQRERDSHVLPEANRERMREVIARYTVMGGLLVARTDGDIVGFVMFSRESGGYERSVDRGIIENLYVDPDHREEGIGSDLLGRAETRLRRDGADTIVLEVMADNEPARRFYRSHGYEPHRLELEKGSDTHTKE